MRDRGDPLVPFFSNARTEPWKLFVDPTSLRLYATSLGQADADVNIALETGVRPDVGWTWADAVRGLSKHVHSKPASRQRSAGRYRLANSGHRATNAGSGSALTADL